MGTRRYEIKLGYMELKAIRYALGNSMEFDDVVESLFPEKNERAAAIRGYKKILQALEIAHASENGYPPFKKYGEIK